jgi:SAM-dependent methyltransferase
MARPWAIGIALGVAGAAVALLRHRDLARGHEAPGGILIGHVGAYDLHTRWLLGPLFDSIAANVASRATPGAAVLEVGCGPGHLSIRLAHGHGLEVTGLDLDPVMIERARANAERAWPGAAGPPSFVVGDVASLPFGDGSFDVVVSTLSMHHWVAPTKGLAEIGRVLRPGGRALVWDFRPGGLPFHRRMPDALAHVSGSGLGVVTATPWRWPWMFSLLTRLELARAVEAPADPSRTTLLGTPRRRAASRSAGRSPR